MVEGTSPCGIVIMLEVVTARSKLFGNSYSEAPGVANGRVAMQSSAHGRCVVHRGGLVRSPGLGGGAANGANALGCFGVKDQRGDKNAHLKAARIINTIAPDFARMHSVIALPDEKRRYK